MLLIKVLSAGILTSLTVLVAHYGNVRLAGLLISFPAVLLCSIFIIGASQGSEAVLGIVKSNILALPVWLLTAGAVYLGARYFGWSTALLFGITTWLVSAYLWLQID